MGEIKVPEGMLNAAWKVVGEKMKECVEDGLGNRPAELHVARIAVEAALRWLSENPIEPDRKQVGEMVSIAPISKERQDYAATIFCIGEWQRRMFLAPEPKVEQESVDNIEKCTHDFRRIGIWSDRLYRCHPLLKCSKCHAEVYKGRD